MVECFRLEQIRQGSDDTPVSETPGYLLGRLTLDTLEQRRTQLIGRATVLAAADSGLVLAYFQFVLGASPSWPVPSIVCGIVGTGLALSGLVQGLRLISGVTRRDKKMTQTEKKEHLLYFGTLSSYDPPGLAYRFVATTEYQLLREMSAQGISLTKMLKRRYESLKKSYLFSASSLLLLLLSYLLKYSEEALRFITDSVNTIILTLS